MPIEVLLEPLHLRRGGVLSNRLAKAAMSEALGDDECAPTERSLRFYERMGDGLQSDESLSAVRTITANLVNLYSNQIRAAFRRDRDATRRLTDDSPN